MKKRITFWPTLQVLVLDCLPSIKEAASTQSLHLPDGHLNAAGHRVVTELIYDYLIQSELLSDQETSKANP